MIRLQPRRTHRHVSKAPSAIPTVVAAFHHERRALAAGKPINHMHQLSPSNFPRWIWDWIKASIFQWRKAPLPRHEDAPNNAIYTIPDRCSIGIAADWGSGTLPAMRVAEGMRSQQHDVTIHMGDVYFVGEPEEYDRIFIGETPDAPGNWPRGTTKPRKDSADALPAYAMNGNHEMVGGGYGLIDHALPALGQKTTYFALENAHWRIVALDTGYTTPRNGLFEFFLDYMWRVSNGLPRAHREWLAECVFKDPADKRPVILLSHHQPISAFEHEYPTLIPQLAPYLDQVMLWFWGHEHRFALYEPVQLAGRAVRGRCIGHGGMPLEPKYPPEPKSPWKGSVILTPREGLGLRDTDNPEDTTLYAYCGWATLTLDDRELRVRYYNEDPGQHGPPFVPPEAPILEEVWTIAADGACTGRVTVCERQVLDIWPPHTVNDLTR